MKNQYRIVIIFLLILIFFSMFIVCSVHKSNNCDSKHCIICMHIKRFVKLFVNVTFTFYIGEFHKIIKNINKSKKEYNYSLIKLKVRMNN